MNKINIREEVQLTKKELKDVMDAAIRKRVRWKMSDRKYSSEYPTIFSDEEIVVIADEIYDDLISKLQYDNNGTMIKLMRNVMFTRKYVTKVVKKYVGSKTFSIEQQIISIIVEHSLNICKKDEEV